MLVFLAQSVFGRTLSKLTSKLPWQIWAAAAVVLVLGVSGWYINNRAYDRGFAEADKQWQIIILEERERQDDANNKAARIAEEEIARLNEAKGVRDAIIARLRREAAEDPDAARIAIGVGSVRRLNQVD